jgi:hypothetical protein
MLRVGDPSANFGFDLGALGGTGVPALPQDGQPFAEAGDNVIPWEKTTRLPRDGFSSQRMTTRIA